MSLLDLVTGGKSSAATAAMEKARAALEAVQVPTVEQLQYNVQKLVQAGIFTPDEARTFLQDPSAFLSQIIPQSGTVAQESAIDDLLEAAREGGLNPAEQAKVGEITRQLATSEKAANDAVLQRQAERGALTGGETLAAQLHNNQTAAANANQMGLGTAAEAYNAMLQELTSAGELGRGLQEQENTQANTVASAVDAINRFNAAQQQQTENFNTSTRNAAQAANLQNQQDIENQNVATANQHAKEMANLPQQVFQDNLSKATGISNVGVNEANLDTTQGGQQAALLGGIVGTGGEVLAADAQKTPKTAAHGGEIHEYLEGGRVDAEHPGERAVVAGDSERNDRIPALLSEGEVVLPRSIARNPEPDRVMDFLNRIRKPKSPHPDDVATVLHALGRVREVA